MRPGAGATLAEALESWLRRPPSAAPATVAAYRRDIEGVARRFAGRDDVSTVRVDDLDKAALRAGFASWATDHAPASVLRAHSAWCSFFDFLVAKDLCDGSPMAAVAKPRKRKDEPRPIRHPEAAARLLATAAAADPKARSPWPERDLALVATFCVTGIRVGEAVTLDTTSLVGAPARRHLRVLGKARRARAVPVHEPLESALGTYLASRPERFPDHDLDHPFTALFVDSRGRRLSADQVKYLIERLYVRAGLRSRVPPGALVHALRHTFAISALQAGADIVELQSVLGHCSIESTKWYLDTAVSPGRRRVGGPAGGAH